MAKEPYAVLQISGHQVKVERDSVFSVDRINRGDDKPGSKLSFTEVVLASDGEGNIKVGTPFVDGCKVTAEIIDHPRGKKVRIFKMKPKKRYRRTQGHRSDLTTLKVTSLEI